MGVFVQHLPFIAWKNNRWIVAGGAKVVPGATDTGLDLALTTQALNGVASINAALSIADFNLFRLQAIQAFDSIDGKMRELLSVVSPAC